MSKGQFIILSVLSVLASLLMVIRMLLLQNNELLQQQLMQTQMEISQAQNMVPLLERLTLRIQRASESEPDLKDLLRQYKLPAQKTQAGQ